MAAARLPCYPPSLALLESQSGPFASRVLTALPSSHGLTLDSPVFRALLLRRRPVDLLGDHRAACPRSGLPLLAMFSCSTSPSTRAPRIEVMENGRTLWCGAQLAVDTTLVSPLDASGAAGRHQRQYRAAALRLARRAQERTYPEPALAKVPACCPCT